MVSEMVPEGETRVGERESHGNGDEDREGDAGSLILLQVRNYGMLSFLRRSGKRTNFPSRQIPLID